MQRPDPMAMHYRIVGPLRPDARHTLGFGEQARRHALGRYGRMFGGQGSATLSGHEGSGPAQGHRHAYFLPADEDRDGRLDHLTVYARGGFHPQELQALESLSFVTWRRASVRLELAGAFVGAEIDAVPGFEPAAAWRSFTPMVLFRHPKKYRRGDPKLNEAGRQIDGPEDQLYREWGYRQRLEPELPNLRAVEIIPGYELRTGQTVGWLRFDRRRREESRPVTNLAFGFDIRFDGPVAGPVAVGYGAHFGLGRFYPVPQT